MRKTCLLLLFTLLSTIEIFSQENTGVNFQNLSLNEALSKAKNNKNGTKLVFVDCYTTWCGPCKYLDKNIFPLKEAGDFFNAHFVNIKKDMEKGEGVEIARKYTVTGYPTLLILDENGKETGRVTQVGGDSIALLIGKVKAAMNQQATLAKLKASFAANKTIDNAMAYIKALAEATRYEEMDTFINEYFDDLREIDKYSETLWSYAWQGMAKKGSKLFAYVLENKAAYNWYIGKDRVDEALTTTYKNIVLDYLSGKRNMPKEELDKTIQALTLIGDKDKESRFYIMIARYYAKNEMAKIIELFNPENFYSNMTLAEQQNIERVFIQVKGMPQKAISKYYHNKAEILKPSVEYYEEEAKKYE